MIKEINASILFNELNMIRTIHQGSILIFEGYSDALLFKKFIDTKKCQYIVAHSKFNCLELMEKITISKIEGVMAIVDNDYWLLDDLKITDPNIILTDTHDSETMLLQSNALDDFLLEYGDAIKINHFLSTKGNNIRDTLLNEAKFIGYLRWHSLKNSIKAIKVKNLKYNRFISKIDLEIDVKVLIKESLSKECNLNNKILTLTILQDVINRIDSRDYNLWQICSGHDLINILSIGLINIFGNSYGKNKGNKEIEKILRLTYQFEYFKNTELYQSIRNWEQKREKFIVLKNQPENSFS